MTNYTKRAIHYIDSNGNELVSKGPGPYLPTWQASPVLKQENVNLNLLEHEEAAESVQHCLEKEVAIFGPFIHGPRGYLNSSDPTTSLIASLRSMEQHHAEEYLGAPVTNLYLPVFNSFDAKGRKLVAIMTAMIHWRSYFFDLLPDNIRGMVAVLDNNCYGKVTFTIDGAIATTTSINGDHDSDFDQYEKHISIENFQSQSIADGTKHGLPLDLDGCLYDVHVYPSEVRTNIGTCFVLKHDDLTIYSCIISFPDFYGYLHHAIAAHNYMRRCNGFSPYNIYVLLL
jgi:hypothetical protein